MRFTWEERDIKGGRKMRLAAETDGRMIAIDVTKEISGFMLVRLRDGVVEEKNQSSASLAAYLNRHRATPFSTEL